jgi:hypothetical protein
MQIFWYIFISNILYKTIISQIFFILVSDSLNIEII